MSRQTTAEDSIKLLIACIQNANSGKINWAGVANDCEITANAASKRYAKILRDNGIQRAPVLDRGARTVPGSKNHARGSQGKKGGQEKGKEEVRGQRSGEGRASKKRKREVRDEEVDGDEEGDEVEGDGEDAEEGIKVKHEPGAGAGNGDEPKDEDDEDYEV